jgi:GlpG protein
MRLIGHLESESSARTFGDFLFVQGVENQLEFSKDEGWGIWIKEEEKIQSASKLLASFLENPNDPKYQQQATSAEALRAERAKSEEVWRNRLRNRRHLFRPLTGYGFGPLTFVFIVISILVFVLSQFGTNLEPIQGLFITPFMVGGNYFPPNLSLPEIRHGEIWRLFTPMFVHFNVLHIAFNMLWLKDLGSMIEGRQSSLHLAILALAVAVGSNLAQFYVTHHPTFGGMSGVVYGLLGYVWIRGKLDPGSGLFLHRSTVVMMLIWLVACFTNLLGPVANYAHLAGLLMGMAWGWLSSVRH